MHFWRHTKMLRVSPALPRVPLPVSVSLSLLPGSPVSLRILHTMEFRCASLGCWGERRRGARAHSKPSRHVQEGGKHESLGLGSQIIND